MAIVNKYNNTTAIYHGGVSYSSVFKNLVQYFPDPRTPPVPIEERIEVEIKADSSGRIYLPKTPYLRVDWNVSIDDGTPIAVSTSSSSNSWYFNGYTANQTYNVKITPITERYGWAKAFNYGSGDGATYLQSVIYDSSYMGYAVSATDTGNDFRKGQYYRCRNITSAPFEYMPDTVTTVGNNFRNGQYEGCTGITNPVQEVISDSVVTIGDAFRFYQYKGCTSLTSASQEVIPNSVTSIGNSFRGYQYTECSNITSTTPEVLSTSLTTIGDGFRNGQYSNTGVTSGAIEVIPNTVTSIGNFFRASMYHQCYSLLTIQPEVIPSGVTIDTIDFRAGMYRECTSLQNTVSENSNYTALNNTIGNYFRSGQYYGCTSIVSAAIETLPSNVTSIGHYFRESQYYNCTALQASAPEVFSSAILSVGNDFRRYQYFWCPITSNIVVMAFSTNSSGFRNQQYIYSYNPAVTVKIYGSVVDSGDRAMGLPDTYVQEIQVDSSLISAYQSASNWSYITPSKFTSLT